MNQSIIPSADVSKLKNILKKSKDVMNQIENGSNNNQSINQQSIDNRIDNYQGDSNKYNKPIITKENYEKSNMPKAIKDMMMKSNNQDFPIDNVTHLVENRINETPNNKKSNEINKAEIKGVVKEVLLEFLLEDYSKKLTETTIKKTINTLIKEGKIKIKK